MTMYKLIELTENGQVVTKTGWKANVQNEAIISIYPLIIVEETKEGFYLVGKKLEGEIFDWVEPKQLINHAFDIDTFEGGSSFKIGWTTEDSAFEVETFIESNSTLLSEIGYTIIGNKLECVEHGKESYISLNDYEPTKEEVKKYIEILGYTYVEL
jgi:hypothetical protein